MQKNAWHISKILVERIDGAAVLGERIKSYLSESHDEMFYFNQKYLTQFNSSSSSSKMAVPGAAYIEKVMKFFDTHYNVGELFMEFMKRTCSKEEETCDACVSWTGLPAKRVYPSQSQILKDHSITCQWL